QTAFSKYYFQTGRAFQPNFDNKKSILDIEFRRYVLATYARDLGIDRDARSRHFYGMMQRKAWAEEYLNREVLADVQVSDSDTRELFRRYNTRLRASHLYAPDKKTADSLYQLIQDGIAFEKLAEDVFNSRYLAQNGGDLGFFTVDEMDIAFENAAFNMNVGDISSPVKTEQGYSIIRLDFKKTIPIITEYQYASQKHQLESLAYNRNIELATRKHLEQTVYAINIDDRVIEKLWSDVSSNRSIFLTEGIETENFEALTDMNKDLILAEYGSFQFTLEDFLKEAYFTPAESRSRIYTGYRFNNFVKGLIYRSYIIDEFKKSPHFHDPTVQESIDFTFYGYLNRRVTEHLRETIQVSRNELMQEYFKNQEMYDYPLRLNLARLVVDNQDLAHEILDKLKSGEAWSELLQKHTLLNQDLNVDGEMGMRVINELGVHATKVLDMEKNDYRGPFEYHLPGQWVIFKAIDRDEPRPANFEEVIDLVEDVVREEKINRQRKQIIDEVKEQHGAVLYLEKLENLTLKL
ncbi:MAG: peptidylprolyl isomerase, partial [Balneolaceae bacterium]